MSPQSQFTVRRKSISPLSEYVPENLLRCHNAEIPIGYYDIQWSFLLPSVLPYFGWGGPLDLFAGRLRFHSMM